jgi:hypothetical protein
VLLTARLDGALDSMTSVFGTKPPTGSRTRRDLEQGYWLGATAALEELALRCSEYGEMLDTAGLMYDEACGKLADLQAARDESLRRSANRSRAKG